jgi:hypothetical protein
VKHQSSNAWVDRFDTAWSNDEIADRIAIHAVPASNFHDRAPPDAAVEMRQRLSSIFVPSAQSIAIIKRLIGMARAHAEHHYPDSRAYLRGINAPSCPLQEMPALCLTGLAGSGKSEIAKAVERLLSDGPTVDPGSGYQAVASEAVWRITVKDRRSLKALLEEPLSGRLGGLGSFNSDAKLCKQAGRLAFQLGVALLIADELQFNTLSAANVMLTALLHQFRFIGLPFVFIGNFSLCHRLLRRRPQEDQHRLLTDPIVVVPDRADDPVLRQLYKQYGIATDGALCSRPDDQLEKIEYYCSGVKRIRRDLLVLAYRFAREKRRHEVSSEDLDEAYRSTAFTIYRREAEALRGQNASGQKAPGREDLWCPFASPLAVAETDRNHARDAEQTQVAHQSVLASMTASERTALASIERGQRASSGERSLVSNTKAKRTPDLQQLMEGTVKHLKNLQHASKPRP